MLSAAQKKFIAQIGKAAVAYYPKYKILPSLTIAQAILESAWGTSGLSKDCRNYFGMKWVEGCGTAYKSYSTKEQSSNGAYRTITAKFRKFATLKAGIKGYYDFLSGYTRYSNLKGVTDHTKACKLIREDGWATSLSYSENLIKLIELHDLTSYDKLALDKTGATDVDYKVKVTASALRYRSGPGTLYKKVGTFEKGKTLSISAQKKGWGKVPEKGWVKLSYTKKI